MKFYSVAQVRGLSDSLVRDVSPWREDLQALSEQVVIEAPLTFGKEETVSP